jgi:predicted MFS family arabinose efflux permease
LAFTARSLVGLVSPVMAPLADKRGRKANLLIGMAVFTLGVLLVALWHTFAGFIIGMVLSDFGLLIFQPAMQAYLGDRVPYERRGRYLALTEMSWSISFIVGIPLIGLLISRFNWVAPFPVLAAAGFICLLLVFWFIPATSPNHAPGVNFWSSFGTVFTSRPAIATLIMGLAMTSSNEIINMVFGVWMETSFGLKIAALGAASAVIGISELGGESFSSGLSDRLGKENAVRFGLIFNIAASLAMPFLGRLGLWGGLAGLFCFYLTFEFALVSSLALTSEILPEARATLMAVNTAIFSLGRAVGAVVAPAVFVWGFQANAVTAALLNLVALAALGFIRIKK